MKQIELSLRRRGGKRKGAGRNPKQGRAGVSHAKRPELKSRFPVMVTIRVCDTVYNLRSKRCSVPIREAVAAAQGRFGLRIVQYCVQGNHCHFIVEAQDAVSLSRGMAGLMIRMARALNRVMKRKGKVFGDRYHAHILKTVNEVRNALHYVANNHRKHIAGLPNDYRDPFVFVGVAATTWLLIRQTSESVFAQQKRRRQRQETGLKIDHISRASRAPSSSSSSFSKPRPITCQPGSPLFLM
jgi:putative transposase